MLTRGQQQRNRLRDLKSLGFIEIYRFLKIYNYEDLSRFLESYERFMEIFKIFRAIKIYLKFLMIIHTICFRSHDVT